MSRSGRVSVSVSNVQTIQGPIFELVAKALTVSKTFTDVTVMCVPINPHDFDLPYTVRSRKRIVPVSQTPLTCRPVKRQLCVIYYFQEKIY